MMQRHRKITVERFEKFVSREYFSDVNFSGKMYPFKSQDAVKISVFNAPDRVPYSEAIKAQYRETKVGESFGPTWSTHWFHVECTVPQEWAGHEVQFIFDSDSEGMIWMDGIPKQGLTGGGCDRRVEYVLTPKAQGGDKFDFYVEMAANGIFGVGKDGFINPPDPNRYFGLKICELRVLDRLAYDLYMDFLVISELSKHLPEDSPRAAQALYVANRMVNEIDVNNRETWKQASELAREFFAAKNGDGQHQVFATGHCHIDVAWLWPYAETKRKAARSWASQILYMDRFPNYKFVQSQAQLYEWTKQLYPELYERLKEKVAKGQFIPVGGTWVEMDGNIPSGESFVRQFLFGQRYFFQEFGQYCTEFWLPDTFGYSAQLPQIMQLAGIENFVTQKLSWNLMNKFPNTTFWWEGLDGSRVLTHFPPADTYTASCSVEQMLFSVKNHKDKERSNDSLYVFGHGDGGGGPTVEMLERMKRYGNVDGMPVVNPSTPQKFFDSVREKSKDLLSWVGELYFELHRGTYTSQARTKRGNRKGELLLRDIEFYSVLARHISDKLAYPQEKLAELWKLLLLNQFHDVLPGSSIGMVYTDAENYYSQIENEGAQLKNAALQAIEGSHEQTKGKSEASVLVYNSLSWARAEVVELDNIPSELQGKFLQMSHRNKPLAYVNAPAMGYHLNDIEEQNKTYQSNFKFGVTTKDQRDSIILENEFLSVVINKEDGSLLSLYNKKLERETIPANDRGNKFILFDDWCLYWDAWDTEVFHLEKFNVLDKTFLKDVQVEIVEAGPLRASVRFSCSLTPQSKLVQYITLTGSSPRVDFDTEVDWHENRRFLKVEFPTTVRNSAATYDVQYGFLQRPTHYNTSWDLAKFEVCGHKWADLSEYGCGLAVLNDSKYGYAAHGNKVRLSLLRSPKSPDDQCDMGQQLFRYSVFPHNGSIQQSGLVQQGYEVNVPVTCSPVLASSGAVPNQQWDNKSLFFIDKPNVIIDAVKKAEDSDCVIVRMYEAFGGRVRASVGSHLIQSAKKVTICNVLENDVDGEGLVFDEGVVEVELNPFQVLTLKFEL